MESKLFINYSKHLNYYGTTVFNSDSECYQVLYFGRLRWGELSSDIEGRSDSSAISCPFAVVDLFAKEVTLISLGAADRSIWLLSLEVLTKEATLMGY